MLAAPGARMVDVDIVWLVLGALVVGATVPLLVQLFLTARALQQAVGRVEGKLDDTLAELKGAAAELRQITSPGPSQLGAAIVPAVVAGVRALKAALDDHAARVADEQGEEEPSEEEALPMRKEARR